MAGVTNLVNSKRFGTGPDGTTLFTTITIDNTKIDATLSNYVLYVNLADMPAGFWSSVQSDGRDIRATASDGTTQYPRDLVAIDTGAETGEIYIKVTSVSSSADTDVRIYYGSSTATQPGASDTYGSQNAWRNVHSGVWHFEEASGNRSDSTAQGNTLTDVNTVTTGTGHAGAVAADFESTNSEYLKITDATQNGLDLTVNNDITLGVLFKLESTGTPMLVSKYNTTNKQYRLRLNTTEAILDYVDGGGETSRRMAKTWATGTWYHLWVSCDTSAQTAVWYLDGVSQSDYAGPTTNATSIQDTTPDFEVGSFNGGANFFDGLIDEVRIEDFNINGAHGRAEGLNYMSRATFYTVGAQQSV